MITEEQRIARRHGIGGSDIPIILGLSNYKTPYQLYLEKTGILDSTQDETPNQYWGNKLEQLILDEFTRRNEVEVLTPDTVTHPILPFLRANLDGFIPAWNSVLEIKCAGQYTASEWGENGSDYIPMAYLAQVAHYCSVMNADTAHIAVLIGGFDYREFKYTRDSKIEDVVLSAAQDFWSCVTERKPPAAINESDLKLLYPIHMDKKSITADEQIETLTAELRAAKAQVKELSGQEEDHKFKIMSFMQDSESLLDSRGTCLATWKSNKAGRRTFLLKGGER